MISAKIRSALHPAVGMLLLLVFGLGFCQSQLLSEPSGVGPALTSTPPRSAQFLPLWLFKARPGDVPPTSTPTPTPVSPPTATSTPTLAASARLSPDDLRYRGAFAFPDGDEWTYGGHALAFYPSGDADGPADGYPGSLYAVGHAWTQHVGELSIPAPATSADFEALPRAAVLRAQSDITGGKIGQCAYTDESGAAQECEYREVAGLAYLVGAGKIAWNLRDWYNVGGYDLDSLGWSKLDLSDAEGVWHIGERFNPVFHNARTNDYLFLAGDGFAAAHLDGKTLISGNHRPAGAFGGSQGPTLVASAPWQEDDLAPGAEIEAVALLYYPEIIPCIDDHDLCHFPGYRTADAWGGGTWIETGDAAAVLIVGRKGLGENYYGDGRGPFDCDDSKGWHSGPYQPQILFYDPAELAAVAEGQRDPWRLLPYDIYVPEQEVYNFACGNLISAAYDAARRMLYVVEAGAGEWGQMAVHVWQIAPEPARLSP